MIGVDFTINIQKDSDDNDHASSYTDSRCSSVFDVDIFIYGALKFSAPKVSFSESLHKPNNISCSYFFLVENLSIKDLTSADVSFSFSRLTKAIESDNFPSHTSTNKDQLEAIERVAQLSVSPVFREIIAPVPPEDAAVYRKFKGFVCCASCQSERIPINSLYSFEYNIGVYDFCHINHDKSPKPIQSEHQTSYDSNINTPLNQSELSATERGVVESTPIVHLENFDKVVDDLKDMSVDSARTHEKIKNNNSNSNNSFSSDGSLSQDYVDDFDQDADSSIESLDDAFDENLISDVYNIIGNVKRLPYETTTTTTITRTTSSTSTIATAIAGSQINSGCVPFSRSNDNVAVSTQTGNETSFEAACIATDIIKSGSSSGTTNKITKTKQGVAPKNNINKNKKISKSPSASKKYSSTSQPVFLPAPRRTAPLPKANYGKCESNFDHIHAEIPLYSRVAVVDPVDSSSYIEHIQSMRKALDTDSLTADSSIIKNDNSCNNLNNKSEVFEVNIDDGENLNSSFSGPFVPSRSSFSSDKMVFIANS